jgi:1-acyl-sn-glycerol-3-phosphate acyltransferase
MKRFWYYFVRAYVTLGLRFYYNRIIVMNASNIPRNEAVIFASNHQNAFLDAIVIACTNNTYGHFLVRADIFKKGWAIRLLSSLNMMPVYRIRDGWQSLGKNQQVFERCEKILANRNAVIIFPEGNHGSQRRMRNLSKGFSRIAFESIRNNAHRKIYIVPVGLNYSRPQAFRSGVSVYYGEPILANDFFSSDEPASASQLKEELSARLKKLITHINDETRYASVITALETTKPNYLDPIDTNERIALIEKGETPIYPAISIQKQNPILYLLKLLSTIANFIPLTLWRRVRQKIKDPVFTGSMKFVFGISIIPIYYLLISLAVYIFSGPLAASVVFIALTPSMVLRNFRDSNT